MWRETFWRKEKQRLGDEAKEWKNKIVEDVRRWEDEEMEEGEWGDEEIGLEEFEEAMRGRGKDGTPGGDMITIRMIYEAGKPVWEILVALFNDWLRLGKVPEQFKQDIIVPLYKRGSRYIPKNYRPITLVQTALKLFQRILYERINKRDLKNPGGLTGNYNFGSVKGRGREMVIWISNEIVEEDIANDRGGIVMGAWDADNAFPSLWQTGVDWIMREKGIDGRLWKILREMEKDLQADIRVNGHLFWLEVYKG